MLHRNIVFALFTACALAAQTKADAVDDSRALALKARDAYGENKFAEAADLWRDAAKLRPGHPTLMLDFAGASARAGRIDEAIATLRDYLAMGMVADLDNPDFKDLTADARFPALRARLAENKKPKGSVTIVATLYDHPDALIEGIAIDESTGRLFASSVNRRKILVVEQGRMSTFVAEGSNGLFGAFGLAVDKARNTLWAASTALLDGEGISRADRGRAGLFAFDLKTGKPTQAAVTPIDGKTHVVGDIAVASNGDVFASDGWEKGIYRLPRGASALEEFIASGLQSPQGIALSADETRLAIADYANGIHIVNRTSKARTQLTAPPHSTLLGIDGLVRYGRDLLGIQNGIDPQRLVRVRLNPAWTEAEGVDVLAANLSDMSDPSLAALSNGKLLIVGNAQWAHFTVNGARSDDRPLSATKIVSFKLPAARP